MSKIDLKKIIRWNEVSDYMVLFNLVTKKM
jgi:hypothetical protein